MASVVRGSVVRAGGLVLVLLALGRASSAQQRWGLGLDVGLTRFWGGSEAIPPGEASGLKPYRPTTVALRVDRVLGARGRVGLGVAYGASGLAAESEDLTVIAKGGLSWVQLTPELAYRLTALGSGAELRMFAGPVADLWLPNGDDSRFRIGARSGFELLAPLGPWIAATVRAHAGVSASLFRAGDMPSGFRTKMMPNAGIALGVRFGL